MSTQGIPQPEVDEVQHPTLGTLKFPHAMGTDDRNRLIDEAEKAAKPQEGAGTRFMHGAGLPGTAEEYKHFLPYNNPGEASILPQHAGTLLKGLASPEVSKEHPGFGQDIPVIGPMLRAQRETWDQPGAWGKVYGSMPLVGPPAYAMGKALESGDYAGAAGSGVNIATQMMGLKPHAPVIAEAAHDVATPVVRGAVRGINKGLGKAPGTIGAGIGAGLAHETGIPHWMGAGAGYGLGKELLPKLKIPGENVGLGPRAPNPTFFTKGQDPFLRSPGIEGETPVGGDGAAATSYPPATPPAPTPKSAPVKSTEWPPAVRGPVIKGLPDKAAAADRLETRSMQEAIREAAENEERSGVSQEKREWFARNQPGTSKGDLVAQAKERFSETPPVQPKPSVKPVERGTYVADPRTHEQILQGAQDMTGGGQGKVAMQEPGAAPPVAPRAVRPGFGTAKVPIEELTGEDLIKALKAMAEKKKK